MTAFLHGAGGEPTHTLQAQGELALPFPRHEGAVGDGAAPIRAPRAAPTALPRAEPLVLHRARAYIPQIQMCLCSGAVPP